jgi:hypothetical protein
MAEPFRYIDYVVRDGLSRRFVRCAHRLHDITGNRDQPPMSLPNVIVKNGQSSRNYFPRREFRRESSQRWEERMIGTPPTEESMSAELIDWTYKMLELHEQSLAQLTVAGSNALMFGAANEALQCVVYFLTIIEVEHEARFGRKSVPPARRFRTKQ